MNKIYNLFDEQYVIGLFKKKVLPLYPDFRKVKKIKIIAHKKNIWSETYHVVIEFRTYFINQEGKTKVLPIFCSAHSNEPRRNIYVALKYLWHHGFSKGLLTVPHPLFFSEYFRATFYRGVEGRNLYKYIKENKKEEVEKVMPRAAAWFAKLHSLPTQGVKNFNKKNSRIRTTIPGKNHILYDIKSIYPHYYDLFKKAYDIFVKKEENFLASTDKRWLIHGDAHPENLIKMGKNKLGVIDFTDICLSDFARDLGCFLQQFEYMSARKMEDKDFINRMKQIFLETYLKSAKIKMSEHLQERIENYYTWTIVRTATFFLIKHNREPEKAVNLLKEVEKRIR